MQSNYFFFYFFLISISFFSCQQKVLHLEEGKTIISEAELKAQSSYELTGEWEFYWNQLLSPQDFNKADSLKPEYIKTPSSWTGQQKSNGEYYDTYGYATYRLNISLPPEMKRMGLMVPKIWSACNVWVNGELVLSRGKVGTKIEEYENLSLEKLIQINLEKPEMEIVVQVANYDNFVAGLIQPFKIGDFDKMEQWKGLMNGWDMMWLGCLFIMSFYHLILYFFRKKNISTLYFGIACLLIASRIMVFGEHYFYEYLKEDSQLLSFYMQSKVYYISSFVLIPIALYYIKSLYPEEINVIVIKVCAYLMGAYCVFFAFTPPEIASSSVQVFEIVAIVFEAYLVFTLVMATIHQRQDAILQMAGMVIMVFASINDTLHGEELEIVGAIELTPGAFVTFLSLQFFIIARRFSHAFTEVEDLSANLEKKVISRTAELNEANEELKITLETVNKIKAEVEDKNKEITDSITYAQRIQQAILPLAEQFNHALSGCFVLFKPRDIVSGDFYYLEEVGNKVILAAIDCTGHGVPGAFMSMLGKEILDNIVLEREITEPDKILTELNKGIRHVLKQKDNTIRDGMDICLVVIDKDSKVLEYAGAKNPLIYVRDGELYEIKADKMPIGGEQASGQERHYTKHIVENTQNATFYLFTDGYQDQFGGTAGRKFMIKRLRDLFLNIHQKSMKEQKAIMKQRIEQWILEANERQIDDILVMGIRV